MQMKNSKRCDYLPNVKEYPRALEFSFSATDKNVQSTTSIPHILSWYTDQSTLTLPARVCVICHQLTRDHHIKMYVTAVTIIREFAGAWKKPLGRKNTCNKHHTCKVSLQYEFVGEQLIHP